MKQDEKINALCEDLKSQGYDLSDEYDIIYGLQQMGYRRSDAMKLCHKILPNDNEPIDSSIDTGMHYWYYQKHGVGPGSIPKDVTCLKIIDASPKYGDYFLSDRLLTTDELKQFEIKEEVPKGYDNEVIDSAVVDDGEEIVEAADQPWDKDFLDDQYYRAFEDENGYGPDYELYRESDTQTIQIDIDDTISVYDDGSWYWSWYENGDDPEWVDEEYRYEADADIRIATQDDVLEVVDNLLTPEIPSVEGIYQIKCQINIPVTVENLTEDYTATEDVESYINESDAVISRIDVKRIGDIIS